MHTPYGHVRRVGEGTKGEGVKTGGSFECPKGTTLFKLTGLQAISDPQELGEWQGYTFNGPQGTTLRPACKREEVRTYPPLLINSANREDGEKNNLTLAMWQDTVSFVATKRIGGNTLLLTAYGGVLARQLRQAREETKRVEQQEKTAREMLGKRPLGTHLCECGYRGLAKNCLRHWRQCPARSRQDDTNKNCKRKENT